jgi:hypothetical protein
MKCSKEVLVLREKVRCLQAKLDSKSVVRRRCVNKVRQVSRVALGGVW